MRLAARLLAVSFLTLCAALGGMPAGKARAQQPSFFRIGSGAAGGTYFPVAGTIAQAISNPPGSRPCDRGGSCGVKDLVAIAQSSDGSVANVKAVLAGQIESGFTQADIANAAYTGTGPFSGQPRGTALRALAALFQEHMHVVAAQGAKVRSLADFKGRRLAIGLPGSGVLVGARAVLTGAGLKEKADYTPLLVNIAESGAMVANGEAAGMLAVMGYPNATVAALLEQSAGVLVPIDGPVRDRILRRDAFFQSAVLPSGTYPHQEEDVPTVSVGAIWVVSESLSEALVHDIVAALWNPTTRAMLDRGHPKGREIRPETALKGLPIPLHPGAERYYREVGMIQEAADRK